VADLAWLIGSANQGQGLASEATRTMMRFLRGQGITGFAAFIHPDHVASQTVARHQHLHPTAQVHDGEVRWESGREQTRK
jgi:RimJ/RimL family protein N-acetyltransferase